MNSARVDFSVQNVFASTSTDPNTELKLPSRENRKRKAFEAFEEQQFQAAHAQYQLSGPKSPLEDGYAREISIPFCYRIDQLLTNLEGFEHRFLSPKPPNNGSTVYKEFLEEGVWEQDLILCWLEEELGDKVKSTQDEASKEVYEFVKENVGLIVKGMYSLTEKYEPLHAKLSEFMEEFQIKLKELKSNVENEIFSILEDDNQKIDDVVDEVKEGFENYQTGKKDLQKEADRLKADLRTMQNQLLYLGNVKSIPFSLTRQMAFPYLAEDRYFYLDPPSPDAPDPQKDYLILQAFFNDYQDSVMWTHHNHFQGLLGRTIEMKNISNEVFALLDDLTADLRKFASSLPEKK